MTADLRACPTCGRTANCRCRKEAKRQREAESAEERSVCPRCKELRVLEGHCFKCGYDIPSNEVSALALYLEGCAELGARSEDRLAYVAYPKLLEAVRLLRGAHETKEGMWEREYRIEHGRVERLTGELLEAQKRLRGTEKAVKTPPALRIEHTCPACGAKLLTESSPETDCLECGATASEKCLRGEFPCLRDVRSTEKAVETPAMHASAPQGCQCADCTMDKEPCPDCYSAWWRNRHPDTRLVYSTSEKASEPLDAEERCDECGRWLFASQLTSHPYCRKCGQGIPEKTTSTLTPVEQLLVEWWGGDMENAELFNRVVRLNPALADAMNALPEQTDEKRAYHETHEVPHCPTCECGSAKTSSDPAAGQCLVEGCRKPEAAPSLGACAEHKAAFEAPENYGKAVFAPEDPRTAQRMTDAKVLWNARNVLASLSQEADRQPDERK